MIDKLNNNYTLKPEEQRRVLFLAFAFAKRGILDQRSNRICGAPSDVFSKVAA